MSALLGAVAAAREGTLAMGIADRQGWQPRLEQPGGCTGVCCACPFCLQLLPALPRGRAFARSGVSPPPLPSPLAPPGRDGHVHVLQTAISCLFCIAPPLRTAALGVMLSTSRCPQHPVAPHAAPAPPQSPFVGARQGPRCCWRPLGSRFSRLPASRSLEEDLLLSQGVTASREPPNLYLHCNLYLSLAV